MEEKVKLEIENYINLFPHEREKLKELIYFIENNPDHFNRRNMNGHITSSGILINEEQVLLIKHPYLGIWIQPGGHIDKNELPVNAAIRETEEESGCSVCIDPIYEKINCPINIDIHHIKSNPQKGEGDHLHFDFRYILNLNNGHKSIPECEFKWVSISELADPILIECINRFKIIKEGK